jgi:hypothetical protein
VAIFDATLEVLRDCRIEVIARGADLARFQRSYGAGRTPYRWEFSNLLERLNERLHARDEYGLVIADQQHQYRQSLQRLVIDARRVGTGGYRDQQLDRILDTAHFVDSRLSRMTQLADMVAFLMRRRQSVRQETDARAEAAVSRWLQVIDAAIPEPKGQYFTVR